MAPRPPWIRYCDYIKFIFEQLPGPDTSDIIYKKMSLGNCDSWQVWIYSYLGMKNSDLTQKLKKNNKHEFDNKSAW